MDENKKTNPNPEQDPAPTPAPPIDPAPPVEAESVTSTAKVEQSLAKLYAPAGMTSCTADGATYKVAKDGSVLVPHDAVPALQSHGLSTSPLKAKGE